MNTNSIDELENQITWLNVSGSREVKRLPPHFVCIVHEHELGYGPNWLPDNWGMALINRLRIYIENTFAGRYFIANNESGLPTAVTSSNYSIVVAFEDPAEASFFGLQVKFQLARITKEMAERKK